MRVYVLIEVSSGEEPVEFDTLEIFKTQKEARDF